MIQSLQIASPVAVSKRQIPNPKQQTNPTSQIPKTESLRAMARYDISVSVLLVLVIRARFGKRNKEADIVRLGYHSDPRGVMKARPTSDDDWGVAVESS